MSLRDQLRARQRPSLDYELPLEGVAEARHALAVAAETHRMVLLRSDEGAAEAVAAARAAVAQAEADLAACYAHITLTALEPDEYEALVALHSPRPDSSDTAWNQDTFPRACFLACATELTEAEWQPILKTNMSHAERNDLFIVAGAVNVRLVNAALPKG